jgi:hypothetical protein
MSSDKLVKITGAHYEIALEQLRRLKEISENRLLAPEEVKMYDLLVKNLRLLEGDPTSIPGEMKKLSSEEDQVKEALEVMGIKSIENKKKSKNVRKKPKTIKKRS